MNTEMRVRKIILLQLGLFILGALTHFGVLPFGYAHAQAMRAESVIAVVLLCGLIATFSQSPRRRKIVLGTQISALLGTLVGLIMILIGIGPRSLFDYFLHAGMIGSLLLSLWLLFQPMVRSDQ